MKNLIYFFTLFLAATFIYSCTPCPECPGNDEDVFTQNLQDTISEATYTIWVNNWKTYGPSFNKNTAMEYYTMPTIDLSEFLAHPGSGADTVAAARFVLGMEILGTDTIPHLMLVGANSAGNSMTNESLGQYVYDVSKPCPTLCNKRSLPNNR